MTSIDMILKCLVTQNRIGFELNYIVARNFRVCSREQRKRQLDWLAINADIINSQSHSLVACSRESSSGKRVLHMQLSLQFSVRFSPFGRCERVECVLPYLSIRN